MKSIIRFWATIGFCLSLYGIFWLPKDIEDRGEAAQAWQRWLSMLDQNTALWVFSIALLAYLCAIEFGPRILPLIYPRPFRIDISPFWEIDKKDVRHFTPRKLPFSLKNLTNQKLTGFGIVLKKINFPQEFGFQYKPEILLSIDGSNAQLIEIDPRQSVDFVPFKVRDDEATPLLVASNDSHEYSAISFATIKMEIDVISNELKPVRLELLLEYDEPYATFYCGYPSQSKSKKRQLRLNIAKRMPR